MTARYATGNDAVLTLPKDYDDLIQDVEGKVWW